MLSFCELCNKNVFSYKFLINWSISSKKRTIFWSREKKYQYLEISNRFLPKSQNSICYHDCFCELPRNLHVFNCLVEILNFQTALILKFHKDLSFCCGDICKTILTSKNHQFSMYFAYFHSFTPQKSSKMDNFWIIKEFFGN